MAQPPRILAYRRFCNLSWSDHSHRLQPLPLAVRRLICYLSSSRSLSQMLRAEVSRFSVNTLNIAVNQFDFSVTRDVAIYGGEQLRWYARSLIKAHCDVGMNWSQKGALGDFLFATKGMSRLKFTITRVGRLPFEGNTFRAWYWQRESHWQMRQPRIDFVILEFF